MYFCGRFSFLKLYIGNFFPFFYSTNGSFEVPPLDPSVIESINAFQDETMEAPPKRLKVSDINMLRYEEEFIEIKEIASGTFGTVRIARHRLDGMIYAIKVTRHQIYGNTHQEKVSKVNMRLNKI